MKRLSVVRNLGLGTCSLMLGLVLAPAMQAQDTSVSTTYQNGSATVTTDVQHAKVVYVSGNDLVVKGEKGQVRHFVVPDSTKFNVDGQELTVKDLKPGMRLTRTITTTSTPQMVSTVRTIKGKVWYVNPPSSVILTLPDGTNKQYKVPAGQTFTIDGKQQSVFHLKKGMNVTATVITESPEVVQTSSTSLTGRPAPLPPPPPTPEVIRVLLIEEPMSPDAPPPPSTAGASAPAKLPKTASELPLVGVLGIMMLGAGLALRKRFV